MPFNEVSIVWGLKNQSRSPMYYLVPEIKTNRERYLKGDAIYFLTQIPLKLYDFELTAG